jgi:hypothetical protein
MNNATKRVRSEVAETVLPEVNTGCSLLQLPWLQTLVTDHTCSTILKYGNINRI